MGQCDASGPNDERTKQGDIMIDKTPEQIIALAKQCGGRIPTGRDAWEQDLTVFDLDQLQAFATALAAAQPAALPVPAFDVEQAISRIRSYVPASTAENSFFVDALREEILAAYAAGAQSQQTVARNLRVPAFDEQPPQSQAVMPVEIAKAFHESYERLAQSFGYMTKEETRQFDEISPNGKLMIAVAAEIQAAWPQPVRTAALPASTDYYELVNKLLNHIEDVLEDEAWESIDVKQWNAVTSHLKVTQPAAPANVDALDDARHALASIALAGMSAPPQMSQDGIEAWHARQAWTFIGIAARALSALNAAIAARGAT